MTTAIQTVLGLLAIVLLLTPACILGYAAIKAPSLIGRKAAVLLSMGAVLLTLSSLDFLYSFAVALLLGPTELATFSIVSAYLFKAMNYIGLLTIGVGLLSALRRLPSTGGN